MSRRHGNHRHHVPSPTWNPTPTPPTTDYIFRADVVDADVCESGGMGNDRYMYKVDEDPEVRTGSISTSCAPGDYTVEVSISSPGNVELASATADFTVNDPAKQQPPPEPPASTDATLNGLTLSGVDFGTFDSATTGYTASVANDVTQTTVTPTTNDNGATYAIKLGGVADGDGVVPLAVGSNVITIEVTAADGDTVKTYTITVTRAEPPAPGLAVAIGLSPSGSVAEGTEITVTMSFANLESDTDTSDTDYIFRADVVNADACEGGGMGNDRYMYKADEDPEVRTGSISTSCAPGDYTVKVSISSPGNDELASATADFTVSTPAQQQPPAGAASFHRRHAEQPGAQQRRFRRVHIKHHRVLRQRRQRRDADRRYSDGERRRGHLRNQAGRCGRR